MAEYIEREAAITELRRWSITADRPRTWMNAIDKAVEVVDSIPAADVLPRDEAIKMGAELAAMHGSDATSQQLEEAYLKGVECGMTRRDVRPVVRGMWVKARGSWFTPGGDPVWECSECGKGRHVYGIEHGSYGDDVADGQWIACPNCGADMRPTSMSGANGEES